MSYPGNVARRKRGADAEKGEPPAFHSACPPPRQPGLTGSRQAKPTAWSTTHRYVPRHHRNPRAPYTKGPLCSRKRLKFNPVAGLPDCYHTNQHRPSELNIFSNLPKFLTPKFYSSQSHLQQIIKIYYFVFAS